MVSKLFSIIGQIVMERLTSEQRSQIVEIYYQNQCSVRQTYQVLDLYCAHNRPTDKF